ncbi:aconitate hydratase [Methylohalomonas lacus]|uniref:Aconitate hydratase n=1 Tax=Methylohalomonas lacus TaxID=398773 RepID=A0AAE3HHD0_9GAMM|nr:aconitate hydratase AcnA [Methylohalomonas lacus]MCS3902316.1 aconitate hydratase [Methylohalomonas lacus]
MSNSYNARTTLNVGDKTYEIFSLKALEDKYKVSRLPYSLKILLENLLRTEDGVNVTANDIEALAQWDAKAEPDKEIAFSPARVLMQDFTGVPAVVDLAAMRDAMKQLGGDPAKINPLAPAELVIDHSVMVDFFAQANAAEKNAEIEFERNKERYTFLRWGQQAFSNFKVVPPDTGICHQVNLEYLARTVFTKEEDGKTQAYPDTLVGTDSHTTMINGLGVLGWGVGGIEAEAAMLGQPITMLIPQVIGFKLIGSLPEGATATDLVLTITNMLREKGVVGKFVEYYGDGLANLPLADRATIANMSPEYGATCGIFPIDEETLTYLRLSGRSDEQVKVVEAYAKAQGMWREDGAADADYTDTMELDLSTVVPSIAGPKRPQDRIALTDAKSTIGHHLGEMQEQRAGAPTQNEEIAGFEGEGGGTAVAAEESHHVGTVAVKDEDGNEYDLTDGAVVIAAITSCTNTSNPSVMVAAGLVAKKAHEKGLTRKPWVKTSMAPGSLVVTDYLNKSGLMPHLESQGFHVTGYGCTTCIGNSGPLSESITQAIHDGDLIVASVLSGNRNFEGRVHAEVQMNFLASPPLVVAYALAGRADIDINKEPLGQDQQGNNVYMKDIWPTQSEIQEAITAAIDSDMFQSSYATVFKGDERWNSLDVPESDLYNWDSKSTYVQNPPYFEGMGKEPQDFEPITGARVLALLGDSITTDHISPAGSIKVDSPAGKYLTDNGVEPKDFNSYGARRGNHEVMMRGTFANIRLRNKLLPGSEGGVTKHIPSGEEMSIYDAAMKYQSDNVPLIVIAGKEYGTGSSRDWAAKGTKLLGCRAVLAESFERIHRSNLVGMGVLPLTFKYGESAEGLGLTGSETFDIEGLETGAKEVTIIAKADNGEEKRFQANVRVDTPKEWEYFNNGGILHYVLRQLAA